MVANTPTIAHTTTTTTTGDCSFATGAKIAVASSAVTAAAIFGCRYLFSKCNINNKKKKKNAENKNNNNSSGTTSTPVEATSPNSFHVPKFMRHEGPSNAQVQLQPEVEPLNIDMKFSCQDIGVSPGYEVAHLSEWCPTDQWYHSPAQFTKVELNETIIADIVKKPGEQFEKPTRLFLRGGPRKEIFFQPKEIRACIVTCGGVSPGLNTVIRELVMTLWYTYGVRDIFGVRLGYQGFYAEPMMQLTPDLVSGIHHLGGTILGSSRGGFDLEKIIQSLIDNRLNHVYVIGGDGTHRGANALFEEVKRRRLKISIVGIPKTIDNDIPIIDKSFGFDTAVERAQIAIESAHTEAKSCVNGIGLVVLMGRASGFIAMNATLASREVNCCLIPEVPFKLDGEDGLLEYLKRRLASRGHAVIVVAEGAGIDLMPKTGATDKSGNPVLPEIGNFLKSRIKQYFKEQNIEVNLKYIDPSYIIRSSPANATDSIVCSMLAQNAVHGAAHGLTGFTCALVNTHYTWIPLSQVCYTRRVDPNERVWQRVIATTGQPNWGSR